MKSPLIKSIGEVVTDYGARVMKVFKKGLLGRSLFDFYGDIKADTLRTNESSTAPGTPADGKGGVIYTKATDGKLYYKSNEVSEVELSANGGTITTTDTPLEGEALVYNNSTIVWGHPEKIHLQVRNDEGATIPAGAPLYSRGEIGGSNRILVGICDADDAAKMPCIGLAESEMNTTSTKDNFAITQGVYNTNISGFTGLAVGDTLYVDTSGSAPHLAKTKPTGESSLIQNVGIVLKTNGSICQGLQVSAIGRTNDVPNLDQNAIFLGDSTNCAVATDAPMVGVITAADAGAARTVLGVDAAGTDNSTDVTLTGEDYLSISGQQITANDIDLTDNVTGALPIANGGTGATSASDARTNLGVDAAGTDNSTNVTLAGTPDYITISGQEITRNAIDLTADVSGTLPVANGGTGQTDLSNVSVGTAAALTSGNKTIDGDVTIGADQAGHDFTVHGATTQFSKLEWDASQDHLKFSDQAKIVFGSGAAAVDFDSSIQADGSNLVIYNDTGNIQIGDTVEVTGDLSTTGNIELGHASDTTIARSAAGTVTIEGKEIVTVNKVRQQFNLSFVDDIGTTQHYLSWRDQYEQSSISSDLIDTNYLVPANGRVVAVYARIGSRTATSTTTVRVYSQNAGFMQSQVEQEAEATSITSSDDFEVFAFYFDNAEHFQAGDSIKISIQDSVDSGGTQTYHVTAVLEFDYTQMGRTDSGELA